MHVILAILGVIVTILVLLNRLAKAGIDLGGLNPFSRRRQRQRDWQRAYEGNPVYQLQDPMEVTGLFMTAAAKLEGDISAEQKRQILLLFENEFHLSPENAAALLTSSTHLLGDCQTVLDNVFKVLARSLESFTPEQAVSCLDLIETVARMDSPISDAQQHFIDEIRTTLAPRLGTAPKWG